MKTKKGHGKDEPIQISRFELSLEKYDRKLYVI